MIVRRKRTLLFIVAVGIIVLSIILIAFITFLDKQNVAQARGFPARKITLETPLYKYSGVSSSGTKITKYEWGVMPPTYKVKEYNLFEDYWTFEDENVVVDTDFLVEDINNSNILIKGISSEVIPLDYVSDRVSSVSLLSNSHQNDEQIVLLDLTTQEIQILQEIAFAEETTARTPKSLDKEKRWVLRFHVKGMENLYYYATDRLCRTAEGKWYFMATEEDVRCAVPIEISEKIEATV